MGQPPGGRPHFVLGDRFGASCDAKLTRFIRDMLQRAGFEVQVNRPYAGGFITEHYGSPGRGVHALQLEINRALYLDEATLSKSKDFPKLVRTLAEMAARVFDALARAARTAGSRGIAVILRRNSIASPVLGDA